MRKILVAAALLVAGCGTFTPVGSIPVDPTLPPAAQAVQTTINESFVLVGASADVLLENYNAGVVTWDEFVVQRGDLRTYLRDLDKAQGLLDACVKQLREPAKAGAPRAPPCDFTDPARQADLTKRLATGLHRKIAERRRELK